MSDLADNKTDRFQLRIPSTHKALIARAAALSNQDMTAFILDRVVPQAQAVVDAAEVTVVSVRDFERILELLDNPPKPNARLKAAIASLPGDL
ncbi:MAG TPA: DUF1778 domain-containing protein [Rhizobiaceae bacterium]|nr:DUF1778 domain-containing protein [Rhizobiaceae bacterium]